MAEDALEQLNLVSLSPGAMLRASREAQQMNEREAADRLNWLPRYVRQIESDEYGALHSPAFARGYIRAYGKMLGLDGEELIAAFEVLTGGEFEGGRGKYIATEPLRLQRTGIGIIVGSVVLGLLIAGLWWWQARQAASATVAREALQQPLPLPEIQPLSSPSRENGLGG